MTDLATVERGLAPAAGEAAHGASHVIPVKRRASGMPRPTGLFHKTVDIRTWRLWKQTGRLADSRQGGNAPGIII